ncbi:MULTISPECIES: hypothetical protein [unclassified Stenotrophomonas]|uniref:hypothetical protein n=1 Tax=unclassified Stenotrophomonas TaxID=196198 RepID=UPI00131309D0|nr:MULTISPECIES: hypothetical protein [unclassified Stenotrophomonas]MBN5158819.1 hypothetical protein [Stenotrophomonas maltophilia]MDG9843778.1 hypothetical protein [Stenotrophomonas sp. GD04054]MDH0016606.1 hypothetical protein [Stenotrophomonas sp. GD04028]MDH0577568.1 hypothetical protein [Stenotrophomonas sp. GD03997]MDH0859453.1 hypothetical protein [Stenotrophomonas sp. GD03882]
MDFTKYSTRSKFAKEINAGYSARLNGLRLSDNPHLVWIECETEDGANRRAGPLSEKAEAWQHGWWLADPGAR